MEHGNLECKIYAFSKSCKFLKKPLDKLHKLCYNRYSEREVIKMSDFEKMCQALKIEMSQECKEEILNGNLTLVLNWKDNGNLDYWGVV